MEIVIRHALVLKGWVFHSWHRRALLPVCAFSVSNAAAVRKITLWVLSCSLIRVASPGVQVLGGWHAAGCTRW